LRNSKVTKLRRRIEHLELRSAFQHEPLPEIMVVLVGPEPNQEIAYATVGGLDGERFDRQPGETVEEFEDRVFSMRKNPRGTVFLHSE
jgi:hypothetical protein